MSAEDRYYFIQKKVTPNQTASAVVRVQPGKQIEKLAGGAMIIPENLEVCWEVGHPFFQGCRQRLIDKFEAQDYIRYFKKGAKHK